MKNISGTGPLIWQRFAASWRLLAVLAFGMLTAATLTAAAPVYTRVMNDLGLASSLKSQLGSASRNSAVQVGLPLGAAESTTESASVTQIMEDEIGWFTASEERYAVLAPMTYTKEGLTVTNVPNRPFLAFQTASNFEDHTRIIEGRHAQPTDDPSAIEAVISAASARVLRIKPGDRITGIETYNDCNQPPPADSPEEAAARREFRCIPGVRVTLEATVIIVGIVEQIDPDDRYWSSVRISFSTPAATETMGPIHPVVLPEASFYGALPALLPRLPYSFIVSSFAAIDQLDSAQIDAVRASIDSMKQRLEDHGALSETPMADALDGFKQRASFNQVTLLLLLLQVVGIAIYYVLLVASLIVERRSEEIAMLRSRGASIFQVVGLSAAETAGLALGVALIAPFFASAAVSALGKTSTFDNVSDGGFLAFTLVPESFLLALIGAALSGVAVIIPAYFTARSGLIVFLRGSARPGKPLLQRYYLDFALVGLAALALWQVNQKGSVFDPQSIGGWSADPLLLLSPLLLIAAIGAILARFLPFLLGLIGRVVAIVGGSALTLGLWQMTRSPSRYTQLALLVVMAASVGTFAATYSATTERSFEERALFESGVDVRIEKLRRLDRLGADALEEQLSALPGVIQASSAFRGTFNRGPLATSGQSVQVLALDPEAATSQLWFRDDFSEQTLASLLGQLTTTDTGQAGLMLGSPAGFSIWINPAVPRQHTLIWLRTLDAGGTYRLHELTRLDFTGYRRLEVRFTEQDRIQFPLSVIGLIMTQPTVTDISRAALFIDDLAVLDAEGNETVVEGFEGPLRWHALGTPTRGQDNVAIVDGEAHSGTGAGRYLFLAGSATPVRGMMVDDPNVPLSAIASTRFLERYGLRVGSEITVVLGNVLLPLSIRGSVDFFPTFDDTGSGFVILNQEQLFKFSKAANQRAANRPNEAWLEVSDDPAEHARAIEGLLTEFGISRSDTVDAAALLNAVGSDPIIRAGGSGVLLIALVAAFMILGLGFVLTLYLGGQTRGIEVSVLRAVGLSGRQIFTMICLEYLLIAVVGLLVGAIAGLRISETMLGFLNVTEDGSRVLPPFALDTNWTTVFVAFGTTFLVFVGGVIALASYFLRLPVSRILRLTR